MLVYGRKNSSEHRNQYSRVIPINIFTPPFHDSLCLLKAYTGKTATSLINMYYNLYLTTVLFEEVMFIEIVFL